MIDCWLQLPRLRQITSSEVPLLKSIDVSQPHEPSNELGLSRVILDQLEDQLNGRYIQSRTYCQVATNVFHTCPRSELHGCINSFCPKGMQLIISSS